MQEAQGRAAETGVARVTATRTRVLVCVLLGAVFAPARAAQAQAHEPSAAPRTDPARSATASAQSARPARAAPASRPAREPGVREVIRMALEAARALGPARIRELSKRARLAGLMPQLRLSAERGLKQALTSTSTTALSDRTNSAVGDDLSLGATLTFELDRLVFAPEEVRLLTIERWLAIDRRKLIDDVVRLYFQRRKLQREQAGAAFPDPELADAIAETEALLDGFTDGEFGKALAKGKEHP